MTITATILIADDYEDNRELLRVLLTGAGYTVAEAYDGTCCLAMARELLPDLIMIDLSMPGMDGLGVLRELKADPRTAGIPCVAVTAHDADRRKVLECGFVEYVSKPFRTSEMLELVTNILASDPSNSSPEPMAI
jgi:two-component system, cell cycle response regulator DivK